MFTGIITEVGRLIAVSRQGSGRRLRIEAPTTAAGLRRGGSVAVDGVCLTAVEIQPRGFSVQVVPETGRRSTLGSARRGRRVNLERPLRASGELGGHFVQGHVDGCASVVGLKRFGEDVVLAVRLPSSFKGLVVEKGSITVNGVSLTVASVSGGRQARFAVALIPHTLEETNLGDLRPGDRVNLEADILGKYVQAHVARRR